MNNNKNLPLEAEIVAIRATAEEAKKLRADLLTKTSVIKRAIEPNEFRLPNGPMRIGSAWYV